MRYKSFPNDRQLDLMDCGPSCLKMIAKYYGKYYSIQFLRDLCGISKEGVSLRGISYAAEQIGLRSLSAKCSLNDIIYKITSPAGVFFKLNQIEYKSRQRENGLFFLYEFQND